MPIAVLAPVTGDAKGADAIFAELEGIVTSARDARLGSWRVATRGEPIARDRDERL